VQVEVTRAEWQRRVGELAASLERGEIDEARWFAGMTEVFEGAYLAGDNPRAQSGFGGGEARWGGGAAADRSAVSPASATR
jgi:hypothetical protein